MRPLAVILAAGTGTRLRPMTDRTPKCLLEVGGRPLLGRLLDMFAAAEISHIVVVTGYLSSEVEQYFALSSSAVDVTFTKNYAYATTNNAASLATARPVLGDKDFLLCDGDVLFFANPVPVLLANPDPCALAIDARAPFDGEAMKVEISGDGAIARISKHLPPSRSNGESIGLQKIGGTAVPMLWDTLDALVTRAGATAFYEDAFQTLIDRGIRFGVSPVEPDSWIEIDTAADLEAARGRFRGPR